MPTKTIDAKARLIFSRHDNDAEGNPAGGSTCGVGFAIRWQDGPLGRAVCDGGEGRALPNGAFVEDVIRAVIDRIDYYEASKFAHKFNAEAIDHLLAACTALDCRTDDREAREVEGTHAV